MELVAAILFASSCDPGCDAGIEKALCNYDGYVVLEAYDEYGDSGDLEGVAPLSVELYAVAELDCEANRVLSYSWDFDGDGRDDARGDASSVIHVFTVPGNYTVTVTAHISTGADASDAVRVTVLDGPAE